MYIRLNFTVHIHWFRPSELCPRWLFSVRVWRGVYNRSVVIHVLGLVVDIIDWGK